MSYDYRLINDVLVSIFGKYNLFDGSEKDIKRLKKYLIPRSGSKFWDTFDWFQNHFNKADLLQVGLYDLNRYYRKVW